MRRACAAVSVGLTIALLAGASGDVPASADTTLGSSLTDGYDATFGGGPGITTYQVAAPGEILTTPSSGLVTSWSVRSGDIGARYQLRILRPAAGGAFTASGTSASQTVPDAEDRVRGPFPVSLSVQAGDRIALDVLAGAGAPINNTLAPMADELNYLSDPLADGETKEPVLTAPLGSNQELLLQVDFAPSAPAPVNVSQPSISGEARAGSTLTGSEGSWENASSYTFQWQRCVGEACAPIAGATSTRYTATMADEGQALRIAVTATSPGGRMITAYSQPTSPVLPGPPENHGAPTITGEARDQETLTGAPGIWTGNPTAFEYQWLRCPASGSGSSCEPIAGATSTAYTAGHGDTGGTIRLRVTAKNANPGSASAESASTGIVQPFVLRAEFTVGPNPTCTGIPTVLDASGSKTPNPPITSYRFDYIAFPQILYLEAGFAEAGNQTPGEHRGLALFEHFFASKRAMPLLPNSPIPRRVVTFTFNRPYEDPDIYGSQQDSVLGAGPGEYMRDEVRIVLTVADRTGAVARTSTDVTFNQYRSGQSRVTVCPQSSLLVRPVAFSLTPPSKVKVSQAGITQSVRCTTATPCAGAISLVSLRAAAASARKPHSARSQVVIASDRFFEIPAHHTATVRAMLTAVGRALLRRHKAARAFVHLTSIGLTGRATTRTFRVVLHRA